MAQTYKFEDLNGRFMSLGTGMIWWYKLSTDGGLYSSIYLQLNKVQSNHLPGDTKKYYPITKLALPSHKNCQIRILKSMPDTSPQTYTKSISKPILSSRQGVKSFWSTPLKSSLACLLSPPHVNSNMRGTPLVLLQLLSNKCQLILINLSYLSFYI